MDQIAELDEDLGTRIQDLMFVFDDLAEVEDRGMQLLLREVSSEILVLALKGADERVREKFFKNLSKRAAEMLADDLEAKGAVRLSEVEAAQKEILGIAKRMSDDGQIALGGGGEAMIS
jgi:flagellar motor switch protein FliG